MKKPYRSEGVQRFPYGQTDLAQLSRSVANNRESLHRHANNILTNMEAAACECSPAPRQLESHESARRIDRRVTRMLHLTNQQVQLARVETRFAIVLPRQFEKGESILVGSNTTVGRLVQINEAALNDKHDQCRLW